MQYNQKYRRTRYGTMARDFELGVDYNKLRAERFQRAQQQVREKGLGGVLCFDSDNIRYITSAYLPYGMREYFNDYCFLPKEGKATLYDLAAAAKRITCPWLEGRIEAPITLYRGALPPTTGLQNDFAKQIKKDLVAAGVDNLPLGVDFAEITMIRALEKEGIEVVDGQQALSDARSIKTDEEIQLLMLSSVIAEAVLEDVARAIRPGLRENEIIGLASKRMYDLGADTMILAQTVTGPRGIPHAHCSTDRIIQTGDLVYCDPVVSFNGYRTCYYRCFCCGKPNKYQEEAYEKASGWLGAALDTIRPGVTTADVAKAFPKAEDFGYKNEAEAFLQQYGHGIGLTNWEKPIISRRFSFDHPQEIKKNMVFAVETWCKAEDGSGAARIEEVVVVTDDGCELITTYPSDHLISCGVPGSEVYV
ncbi:MAG: Xaa-Pro peptidase family protein [Oscillospiraceae bacterium]|nr:Xaa-Pro peptidase family protein [Oscillospiraceae bacterium]